VTFGHPCSDQVNTIADLFALRRQSGRTVATLDLMIASIAGSRSTTVVTQNVSDFAEFEVPVTNP